MTDPPLFTQPASTSIPQRWRCPLCQLTYTSPLPLEHPPRHNCHPAGLPMRQRRMEPDNGEGET